MKRSMMSITAMLMVFTIVACGNGKVKTVEPVKTVAGHIGVSMPTKSSERWIRDGDGIKKGLEALGYVVDLQFAEDSVDAQLSQIENMITKEKVKALVIAAIDGSTLTDIVAKAKAQGAVVIAYDRLLINTKDVDYYATFDSIAIGKLQGGYIVDKLGLKDGKGPFNIELFAGSLDDNNTPLYFDGALMELKPYLDNGKLVIRSKQTELKQVATQNWDGQVAQARMDNLLSANYSSGSVVHAVLSPYDGLSIGILASLKAVGYGKSAKLPFPVITGQDCEPTSIKSIIADEQTSSVFVDTRELAKVAVKLVSEALSGKPVTINKPDAYDNGAKKVSAMAINAQAVDKANYKTVLIDSGYYKEEDLK
jgi:putative multiple sugar transport system substrate-binding protein